MTHTTFRTIAVHVLAAALFASLASGCSEPAQAAEVTPPAQPRVEAPAPVLEPSVPEVVEPAMEDAVEDPVEEPSAELHVRESVRARRMLLARRVEAREPVSPATTFSASNERLYAFFELQNSSDEDQFLSVTFEGPDGRSTGHVELEVPAESWRWRTWAWSQHVNEPGSWRAELRTEAGELVAAHDFFVE
ncbi:MAG: DUF2914 domain-containing protein [Myxococcota bacterium]